MLKLHSEYLYLFENVCNKYFYFEFDDVRIFLLANIEGFILLALKSIRNFLFLGAMRCSGLFAVFSACPGF